MSRLKKRVLIRGEEVKLTLPFFPINSDFLNIDMKTKDVQRVPVINIST